MLPVKVAARPMLYVVLGPQSVDCALQAGGRWLVDGRIVVNFSAGMDEGSRDDHALAYGDGIARGFEKVVAWLDARSGAQSKSGQSSGGLAGIRVLVADVWIAQVCLPWNPALRQTHGAVVYAREQFAASGFTLAYDDVIRLDEAPYGQERLAFAYPQWLLSAIDRFGRSVKGAVRSILPFSVAAWALRSKGPRKTVTAVGLVCDGMSLVTYGSGQQSEVAVRRAAVTDSDSSALVWSSISPWAGLSDQWRRMQLRDPRLITVDQLPVLDLSSGQGGDQAFGKALIAMDLQGQEIDSAPSRSLWLLRSSTSLHSPLDAKPCRQRLSPVGWVAATLGSLFVAVLILNGWQTAQLRHDLAQQNRANNVESETSVRDRSWSRDEIARVAAVNAAVRQLNVPVSELMRALQPPADIRVALLSVEILADAEGKERGADEATSTVKIVGEARTGSDMANYLGYVGDRKPFSRAYLKHHEIVESAPEHPYRFTLEASWQVR